MHSTAQAAGRAMLGSLAPQASAAARVKIGRRRFPPANMLWRMALWRVVGFDVVRGRKRLRAEDSDSDSPDNRPSVSSSDSSDDSW